MQITILGLKTASYTELFDEVKAHSLKCRKAIETMRSVLESHYLTVHGARPLRGIKRMSMFEIEHPMKKTKV